MKNSEKYLGLQVLEDTLAIHQFLGQKSRSTDHCKTSILEFLVTKVHKLLGIIRLKSKWIESNVYIIEKKEKCK